MKMHPCLLLTVAISIVSLPIRADDNALVYPDPKEACKNAPWCSFRASEKEWPVKAKVKGVEIKVGAFIVEVPAGFQRISAWNNLLAISYRKHVIFVDPQGMENIGLDPKIFEQSSYKVADYPRLIFTVTPNDTEPASPPDRTIWRAALKEKATLLIEAKEGGIFRNEKVTAYMARINRDVSGDLVIVHKDKPDSYLRIYDKGSDPKVILSIIASFKLAQ